MNCPKCNKNSVIQKRYTRKKDGAICVAEYCRAGNCNYRKIVSVRIPVSPAGKYIKNNKTGQLEFNL